MSPSLDQLHRCSVAVDIGAARTRVYLKNGGVVVDEPSVVAIDIRTGALIAVGARADQMDGRTPDHIRVVRPVSGGTIVDIAMAQRMLRHLLGDKLRKPWRRMPTMRAAVCMPHGSKPLAQRAATETLFGLGARKVELVDTLIAAAVGCGMPVEHPEATMIVVCGAGTTQIAVLSLGSIVAAETVPVGGDAIDHAVVQHLRNQHELMLPSQSVRPLHHVLSSVGPIIGSTEVYGRDVSSGLARTVLVDTDGVRHAMRTPLTAVVDAIGIVLRRCPPDLVADLADRGIMLAGGSALMPGLDAMLRQATGVPVHIAERPDVCAVQGLGAMIEGRVRPMALAPLTA
ncbi:rod shape-determining protein [Streptomyces sp. H10-C2]|uniref:rod shape-determining protein n=1 Tax=unclassified Streptomyces TaxID=2593676 RepID=UPI0024B93B27|nr:MULTISPECIES: rod shape-determining protein [unclassified Streptomyces]MDJ0343999.1 rod shape-determining protein [Streptomyces sp. PH10-H1]MDJ0373510.1 rod shape-determining protein [Streptomyces sp. H10-C2]